MPLPSSLVLALSLLAPPSDDCSEQAVQTLFADEQYRAVVARSRRCWQETRDPYYQFTAGQAHHYMDQYAQAIDKLENFLARAPAGDPRRAFAVNLLTAAREAVKDAPPRPTGPRPTGRTGKRELDPPPEPAKPAAEPAKPAAEPAKPAAEPAPSDNPSPEPVPPAKDPTATVEPPPPPVEPPTDRSDPPEFRKGRIGLGVGAGAGVIAGVLMLAPGLVLADDAFDRNAAALRSAGLDASFPYGACATAPTPGCADAVALETGGYSALHFHRDLALASRLQAAAVITGSAALGGPLGAAALRARTSRGRRVGLLVALGNGVGVAALGAVVYGTSRWELGDLLQGTDAAGHGETWRTTREQYWRAQGPALVGGALLGLGAGMFVGAGLGILTEHRLVRGGRERARLRVVPRLAGLALTGRF